MAKDKIYPLHITEMLLSCIMSFVWVGYYGYTYNVSIYNSSPVNWLAFVLWAPGLFFTIRLYNLVNGRISKSSFSFALTWTIYFTGLILIEHIGYNVLAIRQVTSEGPLIFGLIHGTIILKIYYISAPLIAICLNTYLKKKLCSNRKTKSFFEKKEGERICSYDYCERLNKAL